MPAIFRGRRFFRADARLPQRAKRVLVGVLTVLIEGLFVHSSAVLSVGVILARSGPTLQ